MDVARGGRPMIQAKVVRDCSDTGEAISCGSELL